MPATRLLVIADSKMLPALANGLRDGARFDVLTVPLSDPAGAQAAAEKADAVALFYGAPGAPLPAALQTLSPRIRDRGGRLVAVLQREQAAQRDDCFRAGASDLLFMPMPKDQFLARLQSALDLSWATEAGAQASVSVATRTSSSKLEEATVSVAGVEAPAELPLKAGETVRLSWGNFHSWGLVVRGGAPAQIRFAGLAPDEEAQIRDWLQGGAKAPSPAARPAAVVGMPAPAAATPAAAAATPAAQATSTAAANPPAPALAGTPAAPKGTSAPAAASAGVRAAPVAGPPPGFADRKPIRPQARPPARTTPPAVPPVGAAGVSKPAGAAGSSVTPVGGVAQTAKREGAALAGLFEDGAAPAPSVPGAAEAAPVGPPWPVPVPLAACKVTAMQLLKDKTVAADTPAGIAGSARKITGLLSSSERAALEKAGPDSHFAESLAARIALDAATAEGVQLYSASPAATVDAAAVAALTRLSNEAAARLQKEANAAVSKGEVESLQMITAASAALSRDNLHFKETADRLRGLSAAPRLGAGALDPDMVLPGQAPRAAAAKPAGGAAPVRAELRDFKGLDAKPDRGKKIALAIAALALVAGLANAFYFSLPRHSTLTPEAAGAGIDRIDIFSDSALVVVSPDWLAHADARLPQLVAALREQGVKKAALSFANGNPAGIVDIATGKALGLVKPKAPSPR